MQPPSQRHACFVGTGGYVALPACIAAFVCRRPLYLCEPNVVPGVRACNVSAGARILTATASASASAGPCLTKNAV